MRIFNIPKKSGGTRRIYAPSPDEKAILRDLLSELTATVEPLDCWHGFTLGRGPLTNAQAHQGFPFTLCFDLSDFFDSCRRDLPALAAFADARWDACFPDGAAGQGLPTSPMLANIAAMGMDKDFQSLVGAHAVYTRYADDLTFSSDSKACLETVRERAAAIVEKHGFQLNPRKTKFQDARFGRRVITGLAVDGECHVTRATKRKLRAASHRGHEQQIEGLEEWAKLVPPGTARQRQLEDWGCDTDEDFAACLRFDKRYSTSIGAPAVLRPELHIGRRRVYYLPLSGGYHCDGVEISEATAKGTMDPQAMSRLGAEEARLAVESIGEEKYLQGIGAKPIQKDDWGELYEITLGTRRRGGAYRLVKLLNSTINPDGTVNVYFRAVPATCLTARAAIAWTFGLAENEYLPDSMS